MSRPQPYRLDWSPAGSIEDANTRLAALVGNADEMFQILFEDLSTGSITTPVAIADGGTAAATAAGARMSLGLAIGADIEAWDTDLDALAALASTGLIARTGSGTAAARTITAGSGITVSNGDGVSGNPTVTLAGGGAGGVTKIAKVTNEDVTNSSTLQNDDEFFFTAAANTVYLVHAYLVLTTTSTATDWKFGWTLPSGSILAWGPEWLGGVTNWNGASAAGSPNAVQTGTITAGSLVGTQPFNFVAILSIGVTGGVVHFQWAQNSPGVGITNTVNAGSVMVIH